MYPVQPDAITSFRNEHRFLSNFYMVDVDIDGIVYASAEHAFQAHKTLDRRERRYIARQDTPAQAKQAGRSVELRPDWEEVKRSTMLGIVAAKFDNYELGCRLLATGKRQLVEGNTWGDRYWGCVQRKGVWVGKNYLGRILMRVRTLLRNERGIGSK